MEYPEKPDDIGDLSGMTLSSAKEYIRGFITTIKLNEKKIAGLETEADTWRRRVELALAQKATDLILEAEHQVMDAESKAETLRSETAELRRQVEKMVRQFPGLAARERSIDPDLLVQELLIAAGLNPGDEERISLERKFADLEKEVAADAALAELKSKLGSA
jgi:phage shock protein A